MELLDSWIAQVQQSQRALSQAHTMPIEQIDESVEVERLMQKIHEALPQFAGLVALRAEEANIPRWQFVYEPDQSRKARRLFKQGPQIMRTLLSGEGGWLIDTSTWINSAGRLVPGIQPDPKLPFNREFRGLVLLPGPAVHIFDKARIVGDRQMVSPILERPKFSSVSPTRLHRGLVKFAIENNLDLSRPKQN